MIRFTPRKPTSTWSSVNIRLVRELAKKGSDAPRRTKRFRRTRRKKVCRLLLRTTQERPLHSRTGKAVSCKQSRLEFLSFASPLVPAGDNVLGHQRKKRRHQAQAAFRAHRTFTTAANHPAEYTHEEEVS